MGTYSSVTAPMRCPSCKGTRQDIQVIEIFGRERLLPCPCQTCDGKGFISTGYYAKWLYAAYLANRALVALGARERGDER
jgi:hypothetical protein